MTAITLLAHQGGWDEALLVAAPMAFVGWLLWLAKRRMSRAAPGESAPTDARPVDAPGETE